MTKNPNSFFKFVTKNRTDILTSGMICFTPPAKFNDPFELNPIVTHFTRCWIDRPICSYHAEDQLQDEDCKFSVDRHNKIEHYQKMIEQYANEHGILSLSASYDANPNPACFLEHEGDPRRNLLMWAHYADKHTGFLIEFSPDFIQANIEEVIYTKIRPILTFEEIEAGKHLIYLRKSTEWKYESEWRCIKNLADTDDKTETGAGLFPFNKKAIKSITVGCLAGKETRDFFFNIKELAPEFKDTQIFFASMNENSFSLDFHQEIRSNGRCFSNAKEFSSIKIHLQKRPE